MTEDYVQMKSPEKIIQNQPAVSKKEMLRYLIGNEEEKCRFESPSSAAVSIYSGNEFAKKQATANNLILIIGDTINAPKDALLVQGVTRLTNLKLMDHMKIKLAMNVISTGTMVCMGKVKSNWMSFVSMSNKKLIDRCIRLISELAKITYKEACLALHQSIVEIEKTDFTGKEKPSPVQYTLNKL